MLADTHSRHHQHGVESPLPPLPIFFNFLIVGISISLFTSADDLLLSMEARPEVAQQSRRHHWRFRKLLWSNDNEYSKYATEF